MPNIDISKWTVSELVEFQSVIANEIANRKDTREINLVYTKMSNDATDIITAVVGLAARPLIVNRKVADKLRAAGALLDKCDRSKQPKRILSWLAEAHTLIVNCYGISERDPKSNDEKLVKLAEKMLPAVRRDLKNVKQYCEDNLDFGMLQMCIIDAADKLHAACLLNEGNGKKAWDIIDDMDTAAREEVPSVVYNYLFDHY